LRCGVSVVVVVVEEARGVDPMVITVVHVIIIPVPLQPGGVARRSSGRSHDRLRPCG
jgi:hypothetical protein